VSGAETDPESLLERLPDADGHPAVLLLNDDRRAVLDWIGLPLRALAVLPPESTESELEAALAALYQGLSVWPADTWSLLQTADDPAPAAQPSLAPDEVEALTERELEVLQLLALGYANKKIALDLVISEHTVKFHISSIYGKLGVGNRTEAVRIGLQTGLVSL
jgi:DNA-binding NarL/FixJ family response regulator